MNLCLLSYSEVLYNGILIVLRLFITFGQLLNNNLWKLLSVKHI